CSVFPGKCAIVRAGVRARSGPTVALSARTLEVCPRALHPSITHSMLRTASLFRTARLAAVITLIVLSGGARLRSPRLFAQQTSCGSNPIVCENLNPGAPSSEWDVSGGGDASIQGFATDISVNHGDAVHFKIKTNSTAYRIDIYRVGYYNGLGARKVATVSPEVSLPQAQPDCLTNSATGLIDCGN